MSNAELCGRPSIGFIVEGHGEYHSYPSIVSRLVDVKGLYLPRVNAEGNGNILRNLVEHIDDLVTSHHPLSVIVTLDLRDSLAQGRYSNCVEVLEYLTGVIAEWSSSRRGKDRFEPIPQRFAVVLQVQTFETWLAADPRGLAEGGLIVLRGDERDWGNIDNELGNPCAWIGERLVSGASSKSPKTCAMVVSKIDLDLVYNRSRSFRKFCAEVRLAYRSWFEAIECTI